ncbi:hypothetical protein LEMLEM_LOCUS6882 [Lemmus lemmus]
MESKKLEPGTLQYFCSMGAQCVTMSEELSNHLWILHAMGCSAEMGKEVQLSRAFSIVPQPSEPCFQLLLPPLSWTTTPMVWRKKQNHLNLIGLRGNKILQTPQTLATTPGGTLTAILCRP